MAAERLRLPPELIGEIVSFLSNIDDRETLLSCALVCQDWLNESRPFLFRDIDICSRESLQSFVSNVLRAEHLHPWLTSTRNIWVKFFDDIGDSEDEPEVFVLEISEHLPNLRFMQLTGFPRGQKQQVHLSFRLDLFNALGQLISLRELHLNHCKFASFRDFKNVLVALPALSSLSISSVSCPNSGDPDQSSPSPRPSLSYLSVAWNSSGDILYNWLSNTPTRSVLTELSIDFCDIVAGLQMTAGPSSSLTVLTIQSMEVRDPSAVFANPEFARLSQAFSGTENIELLRLHAAFYCGAFSWGEMACALEPFSAAGAVSILRLCCCPEHYHEDDGEDFFTDLEELDPLLEDGAFSALKAVQFILFLVQQDETLPEKHDQFSAWLEHKLPGLYEREVDVQLYVYNAWTLFGPEGTLEPLHAFGGPNFPHGSPML